MYNNKPKWQEKEACPMSQLQTFPDSNKSIKNRSTKTRWGTERKLVKKRKKIEQTKKSVNLNHNYGKNFWYARIYL